MSRLSLLLVSVLAGPLVAVADELSASLRGGLPNVNTLDAAAQDLVNDRYLQAEAAPAAATWDSVEHPIDYSLGAKLVSFSKFAYQSNAASNTSLLALLSADSCSSYAGPTADDLALLCQSAATSSCYVAFRGSANAGNWLSNIDAGWTDFKKNKNKGAVMAYSHSGFAKSYNGFRFTSSSSTPFLNAVRSCLSVGTDRKLVLTGHSRGGALASLMAVHFVADETLDLDDSGVAKYNLGRFRSSATASSLLYLYSFGEPRSLSAGFSGNSWEYIHNIPNKFRFVHGKDIVPSLPFNPYAHWGNSFLLAAGTSDGQKPQFQAVNSPKFSADGNANDHDLDLYARKMKALVAAAV